MPQMYRAMALDIYGNLMNKFYHTLLSYVTIDMSMNFDLKMYMYKILKVGFPPYVNSNLKSKKPYAQTF